MLVDAGDVHDPPAAVSGDHLSGGPLQAEESAVQIGREHLSPGGVVDVEQWRGSARAGVVDQHVYAAEEVGELVDYVCRAREECQVEVAYLRAPAGGPDLFGGGLGAVLTGAPSSCPNLMLDPGFGRT